MKKPHDRLVTALAHLERLKDRNTLHGERLQAGAGKMADHATAAAEKLAPKADTDPDARAQYRRALQGRYQARKLSKGAE